MVYSTISTSASWAKIGLVKKSTNSRLSECTGVWFENYISHRIQCVQADGFISQLLSVASGVLQGSLSGPFLFILYIHKFTVKLQMQSSIFMQMIPYYITHLQAAFNNVQANFVHLKLNFKLSHYFSGLKFGLPVQISGLFTRWFPLFFSSHSDVGEKVETETFTETEVFISVSSPTCFLTLKRN